MGMIRRIGCGLAVGFSLLLGAGATSATAYSISGGSYSGTPTLDPSFTFAGFYTVTCPSSVTSFSGSATGSSGTNFTPGYGVYDWCDFFGLPASVNQSGSWNFRIVGDDGSPTLYYGQLYVPTTSTTTISVPLAGCSVTISGSQSFTHGSGGMMVVAFNVLGGAAFGYNVSYVHYTASAGCPFFSGGDGEFTATFAASGVTVS